MYGDEQQMEPAAPAAHSARGGRFGIGFPLFLITELSAGARLPGLRLDAIPYGVITAFSGALTTGLTLVVNPPLSCRYAR